MHIVCFVCCFIYYFNCISFAIRLSGRKVAIKLIDWLIDWPPPPPLLVCTSVQCATVECVPVWTSMANRKYNNAAPNAAATLRSCQMECIKNPSCTGIDWNINAMQKCSLTGSWSQSTNVASPGFTHYEVARCSGNCLSHVSVSQAAR